MAIKPAYNLVQSGPFEGDTTNRVDYQRKNGERSKAIRPEESAIASGPFEVVLYMENVHKIGVLRVTRRIESTIRENMERDLKLFVLPSTWFNLENFWTIQPTEWTTTRKRESDHKRFVP